MLFERAGEGSERRSSRIAVERRSRRR